MTDLPVSRQPKPAPAAKPPQKNAATPSGGKPAAAKAKPVRPGAPVRAAGKGRVPPGKGRAARRALVRPGLLPATIFVAMLVLGFKVGDIWLTLTTGRGLSLISPSIAEETGPQGLPELPPAPALTPPPTQVAQAGDPPATQSPPAQPPASAEPAASPPATHQPDVGPAPSGAPGQSFTPTELELLQRLQERREQLDTRARELDQREAMLAAAEQRFDQKIGELQGLKQEIQGLLTQVNSEQQAQLDSLVKIYETMKPVDAAKIFNSLENDVLINVISRMKEAKVAPVLAAMEQKRAQEVTILLAARKTLPTVPD
ncbi:magnesium transporter MgtE N-terminal domain-containing protein [Niveispirillum fermenti]|uniref:MotE family protein n=1 Tax=Niveispirillum fermenti TaxID=1233113 RepID=UPI003A8C130B